MYSEILGELAISSESETMHIKDCRAEYMVACLHRGQ